MESESCKNTKSLSTYMKSEHLNSKDFPSKMTPGKQMATSQILKYLPKKTRLQHRFFINIVNYASSFTLGQNVLYHHKIIYENFTSDANI